MVCKGRRRKQESIVNFTFIACVLLLCPTCVDCKGALPPEYVGAWVGAAAGVPTHDVHVTLYGGKVGTAVGLEVVFGQQPFPFSCIAGYTLKVVKSSYVRLLEGTLFDGAYAGSDCEFGSITMKMRRDGKIDYQWKGRRQHRKLIFSPTAVLSRADGEEMSKMMESRIKSNKKSTFAARG
ncbi:hypothetical protein BSKO_05213 [Bryopsis sp. KO-2023]|nr:hypothetical protein BSKO_05213 [Bryopsis sp. KO-2023]